MKNLASLAIAIVCVLFYLATLTSGQRPAKFGSRCNDTSECQQSNRNTTCTRNVCNCSSGYGDTGDSKAECYEARMVNQTCFTTYNCLAYIQGFGSFCLVTPKNKTCQCSPGFSYEKGGQKCLRKGSPNSGPCKSSSDCTAVDRYSQCNSGLCNCKVGYRLTGSGCRLNTARLNEHCYNNDQCKQFDPQSSCSNKLCACNEGYSLNKTTKGVPFCAIVKTPINGTCTNNQQCRNYDRYSQCKNHKCQCKKSYDYKLKRCNSGCLSLMPTPLQLVLLISAFVFAGNELFTKKNMI